MQLKTLRVILYIYLGIDYFKIHTVSKSIYLCLSMRVYAYKSMPLSTSTFTSKSMSMSIRYINVFMLMHTVEY